MVAYSKQVTPVQFLFIALIVRPQVEYANKAVENSGYEGTTTGCPRCILPSLRLGPLLAFE